MDDDSSEEDGHDGPYVPARLRGPHQDQVLEQSRIIAADFQAAVDRMVRKKKERPNESIAKLHAEEAPFHSDAIAEQRRLMEENQKALEGQELEHKWTVKGYSIPVVTVEEEERMIRAIERKKAKEEARKRKMEAWNLNQSKPPPPPPVEHKKMIKVVTVGKDGPFISYEEEQPGPSAHRGCLDCNNGPCMFDARRQMGTCANEPMLPELMADLMGQFYRMGWMQGSGGGMAAITCDNRLLISPSSLQKERIKACDLFSSSVGSRTVRAPICMPHGKPSACEGIFKMIMEKTGAQCVIHSHSKASNLATRISQGREWAMSGQEYIKGIYNFRTQTAMDNEDVLIVPIIENMPTEQLLEPQVEFILGQDTFKQISCILVRNHGAFVWGPTWQKTKIMAEIYEYLFDLSIDMFKMNVPLLRPADLQRAMRIGFMGAPPSVLQQYPQQVAPVEIPDTMPELVPLQPTTPSAPPPE